MQKTNNKRLQMQIDAGVAGGKKDTNMKMT